MSTALNAGFVFWGLFLVFAVIVSGYLIWMYRAEGRERDEASTKSRAPDGPEGIEP